MEVLENNQAALSETISEERQDRQGVRLSVELTDRPGHSLSLEEGGEGEVEGVYLKSTNRNHKYSVKDRESLASYESQDYLPPHSEVYTAWLAGQQASNDWDRWVMMGLIGFFTGLTGFFLHQIIDLIADTKWDLAKDYISESRSQYGTAWLLSVLYSSLVILLSVGLVVFFRPSAAGSGMPELIGFLNGTFIRHIFNVKTFLVKFLSCALAVGGGLPVGPEGPMIHLGSIVGAGLSQFQSKTIGVRLPFFQRFRNPEDKRNFVSAGAAAGIASAFGAPVGGLLFAMEEVSSFWNLKLSWQVLFCSMVSAFTTDLLNSSFKNFQYSGDFGLFKTSQYILFQIEDGIDLNILGLIPSIILGVIGGLFGSLFIFINLKLAAIRKRFLARLRQKKLQNLFHVVEPLVIVLIFTSLSILLPALFSCTPMSCALGAEDGEMACRNTQAGGTFLSLVVSTPSVETYTCSGNITNFDNGTVYFNGSYNEAATLFFVTGEKAIRHLFSRNTHLEFDYAPLIIFFIFYFTLSCWSIGTQISAGVVVPMLLIGGLYGRVLGRICVDIFGVQNGPYWDWMDPGAFALLGAVSFFGGVTRLTMSLAVIMVEITNDIQFLLLIIVTIMFAKWTGDLITHSLYHSLLEHKCIPFLDSEPLVRINGRTETLESHTVGEVMSSPVKTLREVETLTNLVDVLQNTHHSGFPVLNDQQSFAGMITRFELMALLCKAFTSKAFDAADDLIDLQCSYTDISRVRGHYLADPALNKELLEQARKSGESGNLRIKLTKFINKSAMSLPERFSLHRTYIILRVLGLRHLTIVDNNFHVTGIITRKDLMGYSLEEKLPTYQH